MSKLGLKLWSKNTDFYYEEAKRLYKEGWFDYIELYVVPDTLSTIEKWKQLEIPFVIHTTHFMHGVNLALKEREAFNLKVYEEIMRFNNELNAGYMVIHSGIEGNIEETVKQLSQIISRFSISPSSCLIENKPYIAPIGEAQLCRGATIEEIKYVLDELNCGFCLDVGHAICAANSLGFEPYGFLTEFNKLNPTSYHLSDNYIESEIDKHLHISSGNYDFNYIFDIINTKNCNIAIETNKNSKENLNDFIEDVKIVRKYERRIEL